jgi:hypothetical protein
MLSQVKGVRRSLLLPSSAGARFWFNGDSMPKKELFIKRVYEIVQEEKIPLVDGRVYQKATINIGKFAVQIRFKFEEDESVIQGFLGLAEYFHTVVIRSKETFYICAGEHCFVLESG